MFSSHFSQGRRQGGVSIGSQGPLVQAKVWSFQT